MLNVLASRAFTTSNIRALRFGSQRTQQSDIFQVGAFLPENSKSQVYQKGQLFVHKIFAYRGIIIKSTNCVIYSRRSVNTPLEESFYYQVLIDSDDWNEMHFPYNLTTCLNSIGNMEQKNKTEYNGMDIVAHDEVRPYQNLQNLTDETPPIKNEHIYQCFPTSLEEGYETETFQQGLEFNQLLPQAVYKHLTDLNEVQVIPFYLGINGRDGQNFHLWRCLFRIRNLGKKVVKLQDIKLDTSTLDGYYTSLEESLTENLAKKLTPTKSVTQFALHFEMPIRCVKGNTLCGYFIAEDDQKRKIKLIIPLTPLDSNQIYSQEQMETVSFLKIILKREGNYEMF
uniref:Hemimethylated DNA-binding domain-containing protein n=1 Tax=Meloidogyne enterolobii TaxID=390850 RepID=A0A6V7WQ10_MELEN|nr:unnamed protein product [Meloidogyne enterolobii]